MVKESTWQRARQPQQKEERRTKLMRAAATLFEQVGFDKASLTAIARQAGISKANIYRYFESKEEIFLHLLYNDNADWVADIEARLAPFADRGHGPERVEAIARELAESLHERPRLNSLTAVTASILEHNVSESVVAAYKTRLMPLFIRLGNALHAALPTLTVEDAREFILYAYVTQAGMWPVAHPAPVVAQVLSRPAFASMCIDWRKDLVRMLAVVLHGMQARRQFSS